LYQPGIQIDLGGIAKGYIADRLKEYLSEQGVTGAIIDLGGNILCMGGKTTTDPFRIGIQQPFADRNETIATIDIRDKSVVSSGVYQRYIQTEDGKIYHHILDPSTGYSFDNGLLGVTIISEKSVDGDGLSTTVFALGLEKGLELVESLDDVEAAFITEDETIIYSTGFPGQS
jgi:thiamine biosynthesis lipoprotein